MPERSETDRRLDEIHQDLREVKSLLIGDGQDGALPRLTRLEQRQGFLTVCYLWMAGCVVGLMAMVVPHFFGGQK